MSAERAAHRLSVPARFEGPPGMANGGYLAGLLAGAGPARVTIRRPVPTETPLHFDGAVLREADPSGPDPSGPEPPVLAELEPLPALRIDDPPRVSLEAAREAAARTPLAEHHPFPRCFGCGPQHPSGLHCLPGPLGDGVWAVAWTPEDASAEIVWSALDCPSSAPIASPTGVPPYVLGRIEAAIDGVLAGEPHVVVARAVGDEGRRRRSEVVMWGPRGERAAVARATWFALDR